MWAKERFVRLSSGQIVSHSGRNECPSPLLRVMRAEALKKPEAANPMNFAAIPREIFSSCNFWELKVRLVKVGLASNWQRE